MVRVLPHVMMVVPVPCVLMVRSVPRMRLLLQAIVLIRTVCLRLNDTHRDPHSLAGVQASP
jgi:hypothetical protein